MKQVGIGLLGFGTVGAGVVQGLRDNGEMLAYRLGVRPQLVGIADLDLETDRGVEVDRDLLTSDAKELVDDAGTDIVVELIGGTGVARELILRALDQGKPVVTANKALLAEHGEEIFALAEEKGVDLYFGASVGGGIPIIRALREGLVGNRIEHIYGILNGTCNYILTRMEREGLSFDDALAEAQAAGYAETDPGLDIDGIDTAHKAVLLASLAHGLVVPMDAVHVEGIRGLAEADIRYTQDLGYRVKLLAVIRGVGGEVEAGVYPALVPAGHVLASVSGVFNAVLVRGDLVGNTLYYGRGAGREPTASTVIGDIADVARNLASGAPARVQALPRAREPVRLKERAETSSRTYMRLSLLDRPGVLARITGCLGAHDIGIASVLQKEESRGEYVPVIVITHEARERDVVLALEEIDEMDVVGDKTIRLRIEDDA